MMRDDPVVDEVRKVRAEHANEHGNDLRKIYEDLKKSEKESGRTLVSYSPKRILKKAG